MTLFVLMTSFWLENKGLNLFFFVLPATDFLVRYKINHCSTQTYKKNELLSLVIIIEVNYSQNKVSDKLKSELSSTLVTMRGYAKKGGKFKQIFLSLILIIQLSRTMLNK